MIIRSALMETDAVAQEQTGDFRIIETALSRDDFERAKHIPGSAFWPASDFFAPDFRLSENCAATFAAYKARNGITPDTKVVCSFGESGRAAWATWLFWLFTTFGHENTVVLNGGTPKWRAEERPVERIDEERAASVLTENPSAMLGTGENRATLARVRAARQNGAVLLDTRSREEFDGVYYFDAPPKMGERAGRIAGARHLPYDAFLNPNDTYRSVEELRAICDAQGLRPGDEIITYCAVGIRSALVWFVLKRLLHFPRVSSYDGSWNEWSRTGLADGVEAENVGGEAGGAR